jgi:hypothetical protein
VKTKNISTFILMMVSSLMLSAFSPSTLNTTIKPKSFFTFNSVNPDEKPIKDDGKKKAEDDCRRTSEN